MWYYILTLCVCMCYTTVCSRWYSGSLSIRYLLSRDVRSDLRSRDRISGDLLDLDIDLMS